MGKVKNGFITKCAIFIAIGFALFTQFPNIEKERFALINYIIWIIVIGLTIIRDKSIYFTKSLREFIILFIIGFLQEYILFWSGLIDDVSSYVTMIIIPLMIYYIVYSYVRKTGDTQVITSLLTIYCIVVIVMASVIAVSLFSNVSGWLSSDKYLFKSATHKNSTGQLLGSAMLIVFLAYRGNTLVRRIIKYLSLVILTAALLYVQSRTVIVAIVISVIVTMMLEGELRRPAFWIATLLVLIVIAFNIDTVVQVLSHTFLFDKYMSGGSLDINMFTSGRIAFWITTWYDFLKSPIYGVGEAYCDNLYINALANGGLLYGTCIILFVFVRFARNYALFKRVKQTNSNTLMSKLISAITVFYAVITLFEAYPPYGPGVCCMMFWIISGYFEAAEKTQNGIIQTSERKE